MSPSRNCILKFHEWPACAGAGEVAGEPRRTRVTLGQGKSGGRPANIEAMSFRHRSLALQAEGPTGASGCRVVRVRGMETSWARLPQRGDTLIARGEAAYCTWLRLVVVATAWWDFGRTLEIVVRVVERSPVGGERRTRPAPVAASNGPMRATSVETLHSRAGWRPSVRATSAVAVATAIVALGGSAMADQQSGTYAHLPLTEMNQYLQQLRQFPEQQRPAILREGGEAVLSEAQMEAPVLTGFLQNSHVVLDDTSEREGGSIVIGVNTKYALAVHETHPTKKRWFLRAITQHLPRIMERVLKRALREKGAR